jgi:hypothetical protein
MSVQGQKAKLLDDQRMSALAASKADISRFNSARPTCWRAQLNMHEENPGGNRWH